MNSTDFILASEPNQRITSSGSLLVDENGDAAIGIVSGNLADIGSVSKKGFFAVELTEFIVISIYVSPNCDLHDFVNVLQEVEGIIRDFNAECQELGGMRSIVRGYELAFTLSSLGLVVLNTPRLPTFFGRGKGSVLGVTAVTEVFAGRVTDTRG